jgi:hypothetical protein
MGDLPTHTQQWFIFMSDLPTHSYWSIFTGDLILKVVYFHGQPAHTTHTYTGLFSQVTSYSKWSIFMGNLPTQHTLTLVYFHKRSAHTHSKWSIFTVDLPTHTQSGLFSGATDPHTLTLVYFYGRHAHTYSL